MHVLWRGSFAQRTRLVSGLVLFAFAATHFLNHALGLVSLDAMNAFDHWRVAIIRSGPGTVVLLAALLAHAALAITKLVARRTLNMPRWESAQIALGLLIPMLLVPHIVNTRVAAELFGVRTTYPFELVRIWPATIDAQTLLLVLVWLHGCIGIHFWLRLSGWYRRVAPVLLSIAVLLPFAAFCGVAVQGRALNATIAEPAAFDRLKAETNWPQPATQAQIVAIRTKATTTVCVAILLVLILVALRLALRQRARKLSINYVAGPRVRSERGPTLLEISRTNRVPHMSVCGGRGRCSTCRVLVLTAQSELSPAEPSELATLHAIKAGPNVRLACQARPLADTTIMPLLRVGPADPAQQLSRHLTQEGYAGIEQDLAVLFVDMRGFTALTERKLAFDVVFILNRFFATVGQPVYDLGGWISNYAGDGMIALFSDEAGLKPACRAALMAAARIDEAVSALSRTMEGELEAPIRVAMGLHAGPHVMGRVGYRDTQALSVIGLAINIASRFEALAKSAGVQLAMSEDVAEHAGLDVAGLQTENCTVRGLALPIGVVFMTEARDIIPRMRATLAA